MQVTFRNLFLLLIMLNTKHYGFSLEIIPPIKWQQQFNLPPGVVYQFIAPHPQNNFSSNLNVSKSKAKVGEKELKTFADIGNYLEKTQVRIFPMFKVLEKKERKYGLYSGIVVVISYAYGTLDLSAFQFAFRHGDDLVNVVYTCLNEELARMKPEFEKSVATLKMDDSPAAINVKP
jgi:hypothetical protein